MWISFVSLSPVESWFIFKMQAFIFSIQLSSFFISCVVSPVSWREAEEGSLAMPADTCSVIQCIWDYFSPSSKYWMCASENKQDMFPNRVIVLWIYNVTQSFKPLVTLFVKLSKSASLLDLTISDIGSSDGGCSKNPFAPWLSHSFLQALASQLFDICWNPTKWV